jgi:hypothetical protein
MPRYTRCVVGCLLVWSAVVGAGAPESGWKADVSGATIPKRPASGMIAGQKFVVEKAELSGGNQNVGGPGGRKPDHLTWFLKLRQGRDFFADREFMIFIATKLGDRTDGKTFTVRPGKTFEQADPIRVGSVTYPPIQGVHMSYKTAGQSLPKTDMSSQYSMRLQFGRRRGSAIPGQVYLTVHDKARSYVAGNFTAVITK